MDKNLLRSLLALHGGRPDTCWISADGALKIARESGLVREPVFSIRRRDRKTYLYCLLFEVANAVAEQSANPAALDDTRWRDDAGTWDPARKALLLWAKRSTRQLEKLLNGFDAAAEPEARTAGDAEAGL